MKLVALLLLLSSALCQGAQESVLTQADELFAARDDVQSLEKALTLMQDTVRQDPQNFELLWRISKFSFYLSDKRKEKDAKIKLLHQGIDAARKAIAVDEKRPEGHFWLAACSGDLADEKGMWSALSLVKTIRKEFEFVLETNPEYQNGAVYRALGEMDLRTPGLLGGDDKEGMRLLEKGAKEAPDNSDLKWTLAGFKIKKGETAEGLQLLESILQVDDPLLSPGEQKEIRQRTQVLIDHLNSSRTSD